jgi:hypothetical protein
MSAGPGRLMVAGGVFFAAAALSGCEYADAGPVPAAETGAAR